MMMFLLIDGISKQMHASRKFQEKIDALLDGKAKKTKSKGKPFFLVRRTYAKDATYKDGEPHPYAGETIVRGVCMIGNGKYGYWFKTCTLADNGNISRKGSLVAQENFGEWQLV